MLRASPHLSHFVPLLARSRKRTGRKKRDVRVANLIVYREAKLTTAMSKYEQVGKGRRGDGRSVKVHEFRKGGKNGTEERCRINTRPYTEMRCYSRYTGKPRTIAVIRKKERIQAEDRRSVGRAVEMRGQKGQRAKKKKKKGVASRRH